MRGVSRCFNTQTHINSSSVVGLLSDRRLEENNTTV